jgi:hypothetical protein
MSQGYSGAHGHHRGRIINIDYFPRPNVHLHFMEPIIRIPAILIHDAPGDQPSAFLALGALHGGSPERLKG